MSTTTNLALNEPAYNSTSPTWDQPLNYNATILDQMFGNTTGVSVSTSGSTTYTNITAPSDTAAGSTSQAMRFNLTGALAANQNVLLPQSVAGMWVVSNNTTNAFTVTLGSNNGSNVSAGTTVSAPQGYSIIVYCDGANVKKADDGLITTPISVANGGTGLASLTANNVILGNGTSAVQSVAPGSSGNVLQSNGSSWVSQAAAAGPAFSAYYNGTIQTIPASTWTKATMNAKDFDTNTNYDATTNYRFTPTVAGYYYISASVPLAGGASAVGVNLAIYKNGIIYKGTSTNLPSSTNGNLSISLPILLNGSTDYVEVYVYSGGQATGIYGSSSTIYGGANSNTSLFNGYLIRGV